VCRGSCAVRAFRRQAVAAGRQIKGYQTAPGRFNAERKRWRRSSSRLTAQSIYMEKTAYLYWRLHSPHTGPALRKYGH
jgi:hypothetical protein